MIVFPDTIRVFDVESIGLHGEGFAVGYVDLNPRTGELDSSTARCLSCVSRTAKINSKMPVTATAGDRQWIEKNVPDLRITHAGPRGVRETFYEDLQVLRARGSCWLAADTPWPVEARFLNLVMDEHMRKFMDSPYPLLDIASMRAARGWDPLVIASRLPDELPVHDPLADARQSARQLWEVIQEMKEKNEQRN